MPSQFTREDLEARIALEKADQGDRRWFREVTVKRLARPHF